MLITLDSRPAASQAVHLGGNEWLTAVFDNLSDGVYVVNADRRIVYWNHAAREITGYTAEEALGLSCRELLSHTDESGQPACGPRCPLLSTFRDCHPRDGKLWFRHKDGRQIPTVTRTTPFLNPAGECVGMVEVFSDFGLKHALMERAREMESLAYLDHLTGIGNRRYAQRILEQSWQNWRRRGRQFGVAFLDLDHFKQVNDRFGHEGGDEVLRTVARALSESLRAVDFLGRWGGDELVAIIQEVDVVELFGIMDRCLRTCHATRLVLEGEQVPLSLSIGIAGIESAESPAEMLALADSRLYEAKHFGRNRVVGPATFRQAA
jgi:diguanylate cyclase (GGDEF)-like protein/PAS domain S-box-containing protein